MKTQLISIVMSLALITGFNVSAGENLDDVTMKIAKKGDKRGHRMDFPGKNLVIEHMLKNGYITQDEIELNKAEKKADRDTLKALKESGDKAGFEAKRAELKEKSEAKRVKIKEYIENNEDLKTSIADLKSQMKGKHHKGKKGDKGERKNKGERKHKKDRNQDQDEG